MENSLPAKERSIMAEVAAKIVCDILSGQGAAVITSGEFAALTMTVYCTICDTAGLSETPALPVIAGPGGQMPPAAVQAACTAPSGAAPTPVPPVVPATGDNLHQPGLPKPVHDKSTMIEKLEDALYHNPGDWKVWETDKCTARGGNAPDITHEHIKSGNYKVGIFLVDSRSPGKCAPEWAFAKLGLQAEYAALVAAGTIVP